MAENDVDITSSDDFSSFDNYELIFPIHLNDVIYDVSRYCSSSFQDFMDAMIQVKLIDSNIKDAEVFKKDIIRETLSEIDISDFEYFISKCKLDVTNSMDNYFDTLSEDFYSHFISFSEYGMQVEYIVALIENQLKESLKETEYSEFIDSIKNNTDLNGIKAFTDDHSINDYISLAGGRAGGKFGIAMEPSGIALWELIKKDGFSAFVSKEHGQLLIDGLKRFVNGSSSKIVAQSTAEEVAKKGMFNSRIVKTVGPAVAMFVIGMGIDAVNGDLDWEKTIVHAAKSGVTLAAGVAGTAVTDAIVEGIGAGCFGGIAGIAVGAIISVVGNIFVDGLVYDIYHASNDLPVTHKTISTDTVRQLIEEQGVLTSVPKLYKTSDESLYDSMNVLISNGANNKVIEFVEQRILRDSVDLMDYNETYKYTNVYRVFKDRCIEYNLEGVDSYLEDIIVEDFILHQNNTEHAEVSEDELEFIRNLCHIFSTDNLHRPGNEKLLEIYNNLIDNEILDYRR